MLLRALISYRATTGSFIKCCSASYLPVCGSQISAITQSFIQNSHRWTCARSSRLASSFIRHLRNGRSERAVRSETIRSRCTITAHQSWRPASLAELAFQAAMIISLNVQLGPRSLAISPGGSSLRSTIISRMCWTISPCLPPHHQTSNGSRDFAKRHRFTEDLVKLLSRPSKLLSRVSGLAQEFDNFITPENMRHHDRINVRAATGFRIKWKLTPPLGPAPPQSRRTIRARDS